MSEGLGATTAVREPTKLDQVQATLIDAADVLSDVNRELANLRVRLLGESDADKPETANVPAPVPDGLCGSIVEHADSVRRAARHALSQIHALHQL